MTRLIDDLDNVFFNLRMALDPIHRGFMYDSDQKRIFCHDCAWELQPREFIAACAAHDTHRKAEQRQILDAFKATL